MSQDLPAIPKKSPLDHIVNLIKAGCASVPFAGGLATLIDDYIPKSTEASLNKFISDLKKRLVGLEERIDIETINKDEFAELFKSCYLGIIRTTHREKIRIFSNIFANIMLKDKDPGKSSYSELDHLVRSMDNLSVGALRILTMIYKDSIKRRNNRFTFRDISSKVADLSPSLIMGLMNELHAVNLIHMPDAPAVREQDYLNYSFEFTELGRIFIERFTL